MNNTTPLPASPPKLIDTISIGFGVINRFIGVLIIPIAINLFLWLGIRVSLEPFLVQNQETLMMMAAFLTTDPAQQDQVVQTIQQADMRLPLALVNYLPVLETAGLRSNPLLTPSEIVIGDVGGVGIAFLIINGVSLALSSIYLNDLSNGVLIRLESVSMRLKRAFSVAIRIIGYLLFMVLILLVVGLPCILFLFLFGQSFPFIVPFIVIMGFLTWFYITIYTGFAIEAMLISDLGPYHALRMSIALVHRYFFGAFGLWVMNVLIVAGLGIIWEQISSSFLGLLVAIVGSAYVGSGMAAARLVFYRDRRAGLAVTKE